MPSFWLWSLLRWVLWILHQYKMLLSQGWVLEAGKTPPVRSWYWKASKEFPYTSSWNKGWVLLQSGWIQPSLLCRFFLWKVARERPFFFESINPPAVQCLGDTGSEDPCYHMGSGLVNAWLAPQVCLLSDANANPRAWECREGRFMILYLLCAPKQSF